MEYELLSGKVQPRTYVEAPTQDNGTGMGIAVVAISLGVVLVGRSPTPLGNPAFPPLSLLVLTPQSTRPLFIDPRIAADNVVDGALLRLTDSEGFP